MLLERSNSPFSAHNPNNMPSMCLMHRNRSHLFDVSIREYTQKQPGQIERQTPRTHHYSSLRESSRLSARVSSRRRS